MTDSDHGFGCDADGDATHWLTNGGKRCIEISKMGSVHLLNAVEYVKRRQEQAAEVLPVHSGLSDDQLDRGPAGPHPALSGLEKEVRRRGLEHLSKLYRPQAMPTRWPRSHVRVSKATDEACIRCGSDSSPHRADYIVSFNKTDGRRLGVCARELSGLVSELLTAERDEVPYE